MEIKLRAKYNQKPLSGTIRLSLTSKNKPVHYTMRLFNESVGEIKLPQSTFKSIESAITYAAKYGFGLSHWAIETTTV